MIFFYAVVFNSLLARTLRGHFRELYFSSSITRVSIPWAGGVHSKMPTTVSSSSCSNVCNDGPSTSSSRPAAKSRSRLFGERKREGGNAGAGIPGMDEARPHAGIFQQISHDSTRIVELPEHEDRELMTIRNYNNGYIYIYFFFKLQCFSFSSYYFNLSYYMYYDI